MHDYLILPQPHGDKLCVVYSMSIIFRLIALHIQNPGSLF